jgi:hypothetical protein
VKLRKVISGGQTGADFTALFCAKALGLDTGGTCPKGCKIEDGVNPELVSIYGLRESSMDTYPPRTRANVQEGNVTLWFGNLATPGCWCTRKACKDFRKQFIPNPDRDTIRRLVNLYEVINVAGNRASSNPGVVDQVIAAFDVIKELMMEDSNG